jgi:hypothetical protein
MNQIIDIFILERIIRCFSSADTYTKKLISYMIYIDMSSEFTEYMSMIYCVTMNMFKIKLSNKFIMKCIDNGIKNDNVRYIKYLHINGVNMNICDNYALRLALQYNRLLIVDYLLHNNGNIGMPSNHIIEIPAKYGHMHLFRFLHHICGIDFNKTYAGAYAAQAGHLDIIKYICDNNPDDDVCNLILIGAVMSNNVEVIKVLVKKKVYPVFHHKTLFIACYFDSNDVVKYLHENKMDILKYNDLVMDISYERPNVTEYLLKNGGKEYNKLSKKNQITQLIYGIMTN